MRLWTRRGTREAPPAVFPESDEGAPFVPRFFLLGFCLLLASCAGGGGSNQMSRRSQEPSLPLPYASEEVEFDNVEAGFRLAGTLTLPPGAGPHAAVVLVSGSGPQDRDESVFGHKPFLVLADHLTRQGIAVLRYDDRGVGKSQGSFGTATMLDHASDVRSAITFLRARSDIDIERIGAAGHSEGGMTAPRAALDAPGTVAFLVLLASPGLAGEAVFELQDSVLDHARGATNEEIERKRQRRSQLIAVLQSESDPERAATELRRTMKSMMLTPEEAADVAASGTNMDEQIDAQINLLNTPSYRFFLTYDPVPALELVDVPVLALGGELDLQVPPDVNLPLIKGALDRGASPRFHVQKLPRLNHLFQTSASGLPEEYGQIAETFAPSALELISDWILVQVRTPLTSVQIP